MNDDLNRLAHAASPYLRQHADNPVDWFEWGKEALEKAAKENKPLIISIGYAACHWCHVMAHESFMDGKIAQFMNSHFVCIKIDREERPDIDQIYMEVAQMINGNGGWPLNAFALSDGKPFYACTYLPKEQWLYILTQINNFHETKYAELKQQAISLTEGIRSNQVMPVKSNTPIDFAKEQYKNIFQEWKRLIDTKLGGYISVPKFTLPIGWEFLLQYYYLTGGQEALDAVYITLEELAKGGIYDQIGGGFARYSTDKYWKVPHFEKMLYDNGQLVSLYAHAYQVTHKIEYAGVIEQTLEFIDRELTSDEGGFYSSLNADSEGEEGKFYVWSKNEIESILDSCHAELIEEFYQISSDGNWEKDKNILYRKTSKAEFAKYNNLTIDEFETILTKANAWLLKFRNKRIKPTIDDKILTSWNAIMLVGYLDAYKALGKSNYLARALNNAQFHKEKMLSNDGKLLRNFKDEKPSIEGFLDDYSFLANAFIKLYEVTFDKQWLDLSLLLVNYALQHFYDKLSGFFYYTSDLSENLIVRKYEITDNVIPASNSVLAHVLFKLGSYFDNQSYTDIAIHMLQHVKDSLASGGPYYANWSILSGLVAYGVNEIAILGEKATETGLSIQRSYLPNSIFLGGNNENLPLLQNKLIKGSTKIYVCKDKTCQLPLENASDAINLLI